ncbi:MAG: DoxX family membrane protein [bacterium]|nr:DoxX family membrane protein [bacterium]
MSIRFALLTVCRVGLGGLLLWAGFAKVGETALFALTVRAYDVLPHALIHIFAIVVPWMEIVAGLGLVAGFWTRGNALAALVLLTAFGVAIGINLARGAELSCGCFGADGTAASLTEALVRDAVMITAALVLVLVRRTSFGLEGWLSDRSGSE